MTDKTDTKLRGIGCTTDQRKRIMMAAKFGLGPLKQLGMAAPGENPPEQGRSRSPTGGRGLTLGGSSGSGQAPRIVETALARPPVLPNALPLGPAASSAARPAPATSPEDEDIDSFLSGGRAMAKKAAKVAAAAREKKAEPEETAPGAVSAVLTAAAERKRLDDERARRENEEQAQRVAEDDLKEKEERRRLRQEEKKKRKEERARLRAEARREAGEEDVEDHDSSEEEREKRRRKQHSQGGVFKEIFKGDDSKRVHWGESVKGKVSTCYKGFTDADLDRRFGLGAPQRAATGEKLMTEEEVLAMLRKGRDK